MKKVITLFILFILFAASADIFAIPAFARKYNMSCQTCHSPIPRLKPYGNDFAGNGFMLSDRESPRYYMDTGDEELSLIRDFPIAVRMDAHVTYRTDDNADESEFQTPYLIKLMSGGALSDNIAYYFYFYMNERGNVTGVEDAYLMYNNLFGVDFDIYLGQFQVSDPLFKRELRLTLEDYSPYTIKPGFSHASLKYDRGLMLTYGLPTGTSFVLEVLNGSGLPNAEEEGYFDNDNNKNFALRVSQDVTDKFRIGVFGYAGTEDLNLNPNLPYENDIMIFGPDLTASFEDKLELNVQYLMRTDDISGNAEFYYGTDKYETNGLMAELILTPDGDASDWYGVLMYNLVETDPEYTRYETIAAHAGYLLRRNLRLVGEFRYDMENEFSLFSVGFVSAF